MENFNDLLKNDKVVLVEFFAPWCPHCQRMMTVVDDVRALLDGQAPVYQFDIDENNELAEALGVQNIPTFIVYADGQEKWRSSGEMAGNDLYNKVLQYM